MPRDRPGHAARHGPGWLTPFGRQTLLAHCASNWHVPFPPIQLLGATPVQTPEQHELGSPGVHVPIEFPLDVQQTQVNGLRLSPEVQRVTQLPPQNSLLVPVQSQIPLRQAPPLHVPQVPPQPSGPQTLPLQSGAHGG
jgi:hypothetical protein